MPAAEIFLKGIAKDQDEEVRRFALSNLGEVMGEKAIVHLRDAMKETESFGFANARAAQQDLGTQVRAMLGSRGIASVAAPGFEAPGVVVSYTDDPDIQSGRKFALQGLQTAAGVPLQCDEPADFRTFRIGLFGLDKLRNVERTVQRLERALDAVAAPALAAR